MATEEAFLRSICDDINDALRRLVFADWLDEHGDPRGEWLRVECELAKVRRKDERRGPLEARKRQLEDSHRESLIVWERRFALARIKDKVGRAPESHWLYEKNGKHNGRLNPVLSEDEVAAFERAHRVTLPEEYRTFLLEVGNGGLGPGDGLSPLADAVEQSPTRDLDKLFPFCFRWCEEASARFDQDRRTHSFEEALALQEQREGNFRNRKEVTYAQPGVLYLCEPDPPWGSVYLVITGEDRGLTWGYGPIDACGWVPGVQTWSDDDTGGGKPPRSFFRFYEDWLDVLLAKDDEVE